MLAVLALTAACALHANAALPLDAQPPQAAAVEVLRPGPGPVPEFAEVVQTPACDRFQVSQGTPNFGGAAGSAWLRFRADLASAPLSDWRLVIGFGGLDQACVYWPGPGGRYAVQCLDRKQDATPWTGGRLLFAPPANFDKRLPIYLYAQSDYWLRVPLSFATTAQLLDAERNNGFDWGLYHGLLLAFPLIGLVFYFGARDRNQLYFSLHVAALAIALLLWHGEMNRFDPGGRYLPQLLLTVAGLFVASGSAFYQRFLDTRAQAPTVHKLLLACLGLGLALAAAAWAVPTLLPRIAGALGLLWLGAVIAACIARLRQGYKPARLLLASVLVLLLGIFFTAASAIGLPVIPAFVAEHLVQAGSLIATGLLSLSMMQRVRALIHERDQAGELAEANQKLAMHRLSHDELTGLVKLGKFREELSERLKEARRNAHKLALVSFSLDNFRALSHALSQEDRNEALSETALRLRESLAAGEMLGDAGNHSFVWLIQQGNAADNHAELRRRCSAMRSVIGAPLARARGAALHSSMGIALYPQHSDSAEGLIRASDEALYRAQEQSGSGNTEMFKAAMGGSSERNLELAKDLQQAILRNELQLYFQPIVPLDGTGLFSAEALVRWPYKGKLVTPDNFVPTAEASGLIIPLSDWVLRQAGKQIAEWRRRKLPVLGVSVNISAQEFRSEGFVERVESALKETQAPGSGLILELTEGMLVDDLQGAAAILNELARGGVKAAVDDFGVGYSSLAYLRQLPVQGIKIDRSFLKGIPQEQEAVSVITAIITMGRELGLKVTAEGIETQEQEQFLTRRGVSAGQGWLWAKAMPPADFENWLKSPRPKSNAA